MSREETGDLVNMRKAERGGGRETEREGERVGGGREGERVKDAEVLGFLVPVLLTVVSFHPASR